MKKLTALVLVAVVGIFVLTGFSMDNQTSKKDPATINTSVDYGNYTQYMQ